MSKSELLTLWMQDTTFLSSLANYFTTHAPNPNDTRLEEFFQWMVVYSTGMGYPNAYNYLFENYYLPNSSEEEQNDPSAALLNFNPYYTYFVLYGAHHDLYNALNEGEAAYQLLDGYIENNFSYLWSIMANATNWPTWGGNFLSTLHPDLLLTIFANHPEVCQHINQNLDITFLNSLILKHASPHAMTQATGSSFFTQAMANATANTSTTALPELLAFVSARLGQARAQVLVQKVGHLLTVEQQYTLRETYLYGSSRLGVKNQNITLSSRIASVQNGSLTPIGNAILNTDSVFTGTASAYNLPKAPSSRVFYRTWGLKQYELSNHLGNVQVTISDKKIGITNSGSTDFIAYEPEVKSATDYYAYGMEMPGKSYQSTAYRYGMNTQEKDNEIYGPGNTLGALYWEYDARIARRWNVDPRPNASASDYSTFMGNPILFVDVFGDTIWTNRAGYELMNIGLTAVFGANNPFAFDEKRQAVVMLNNSIPEGLTEVQMDVYQRMRHLVTSTRDQVFVYAVTRDQVIPDIKMSLESYSLGKENSVNGITSPSNVNRTSGLVSWISGTINNVYLASNPQKRRQDDFNDSESGKKRLVGMPSYFSGIAALHELCGHVFSTAKLPYANQEINNWLTEDFENKLSKSGAFKIDGVSIKWEASKHEK